eukprot:446813_1
MIATIIIIVSLCFNMCFITFSLYQIMKTPASRKFRTNHIFLLYQFLVFLWLCMSLIPETHSMRILSGCIWYPLFASFHCYSMLRLHILTNNSIWANRRRNVLLYYFCVLLTSLLWVIVLFIPHKFQVYFSSILLVISIIFPVALFIKFITIFRAFNILKSTKKEKISSHVYTLHQRQLAFDGYLRKYVETKSNKIHIPATIIQLICQDYLEFWSYQIITKIKTRSHHTNRHSIKFVTIFLKFTVLWLLANIFFLIPTVMFWMQTCYFVNIPQYIGDIVVSLSLIIATLNMLLQWKYATKCYTKLCCCLGTWIHLWITEQFDGEEDSSNLRKLARSSWSRSHSITF